jgi:hypothetical protein
MHGKPAETVVVNKVEEEEQPQVVQDVNVVSERLHLRRFAQFLVVNYHLKTAVDERFLSKAIPD